jgi:hypothetical protein
MIQIYGIIYVNTFKKPLSNFLDYLKENYFPELLFEALQKECICA